MDVRFETKFGNVAGKDEWLTPKYITDALGDFDLDPCSPIVRPWPTAKNHYTINDDGLSKEWQGRVWCNPPYGDKAKHWLKKCSEHGNCIVLIFARTETKMFFDYIWDRADGIFFFKGRIAFLDVNGNKSASAGAPSCLVSYGENNTEILSKITLPGKFFRIK